MSVQRVAISSTDWLDAWGAIILCMRESLPDEWAKNERGKKEGGHCQHQRFAHKTDRSVATENATVKCALSEAEHECAIGNQPPRPHIASPHKKAQRKPKPQNNLLRESGSFCECGRPRRSTAKNLVPPIMPRRHLRDDRIDDDVNRDHSRQTCVL